MYKENDIDDLVQTLLSLKTKAVRQELGEHGCTKIRENYSWNTIAQHRINDYDAAIRTNKRNEARRAASYVNGL